jgi:hypothetical protein
VPAASSAWFRSIMTGLPTQSERQERDASSSMISG